MRLTISAVRYRTTRSGRFRVLWPLRTISGSGPGRSAPRPCLISNLIRGRGPLKMERFAFLFAWSIVLLRGQQPLAQSGYDCVIEGQVISATSGEPLRKAQVGLRGATGRES